jgi:hypothetical protein
VITGSGSEAEDIVVHQENVSGLDGTGDNKVTREVESDEACSVSALG